MLFRRLKKVRRENQNTGCPCEYGGRYIKIAQRISYIIMYKPDDQPQ